MGLVRFYGAYGGKLASPHRHLKTMDSRQKLGQLTGKAVVGTVINACKVAILIHGHVWSVVNSKLYPYKNVRFQKDPARC